MGDIKGEIFDGRSSRHFSAVLREKGNGELQLSWDEGRASYPLRSVKVSTRVGNTPRNLDLPNGWKFETSNNDAVDAILVKHKAHGWHRVVSLNSRGGHLFSSLMFFLLLAWGLWLYGGAWMAAIAVEQLPPDINGTASERTLRYLDEHAFGTSRLPDRLQKRLQARFAAMISAARGEYQFELQFRRGKELLGANAIALPSGTVILTDELVRLAQNDDELEAVMAHELAHVVKRHALQQSLQHSVLNLFLAFTIGNVSGIDEALSELYLQQGYGEDQEREADSFAYNYLRANGIDTAHYADLLRRLQQYKQVKLAQSAAEGSEVFAYPFTHPGMEQRLAYFSNTQ